MEPPKWNQLWRALQLIFGSPHKTPSFDEFAMFMAFTSSVRSADLSRQVGAVIARGTDILSTGANDCPRFGGGQYWPEHDPNNPDEYLVDTPSGRDNTRMVDSNAKQKQSSALPSGGFASPSFSRTPPPSHRLPETGSPSGAPFRWRACRAEENGWLPSILQVAATRLPMRRCCRISVATCHLLPVTVSTCREESRRGSRSHYFRPLVSVAFVEFAHLEAAIPRPCGAALWNAEGAMTGW